MPYTYTTQREVRAAFWQGWPEEFSAFVDMLQKDGHISEALAQKVTL